MELDRFWNFINLVFQFNGGARTAKKMCKGEIRLGKWNEYYSKTRKDFQQCIDEVVLENPNFTKTLFVYYIKFQELIKKYEKAEILKENIDKNVNEEKYYLQQVHKTRFKEVKIASYHIKLYLVDYVKEIKDTFTEPQTEITQTKQIDDKIIIPHEKTFRENYDDNKLQYIYDYIIKVGYLDVDIPFENFKYCMTGKGTPTSGLVWKGGVDTLAFFIDGICKSSKHQWVKGKAVFGEKVANSNMNNSQKESPFKQLKKDIGII